MKTIGLLGGMSWESTIPYYQIINEEVRDKLGGLHSAKIVLFSVEFEEIEQCQSSGDWEKSGDILGKAAQGLEAAGADMLLICTNTMHKVAPQIASMVQIPLVHIADATADELEKSQIRRVGLLGTKYTMTQDFYKQILIDRGIDVVIPDAEDVGTVNDHWQPEGKGGGRRHPWLYGDWPFDSAIGFAAARVRHHCHSREAGRPNSAGHRSVIPLPERMAADQKTSGVPRPCRTRFLLDGPVSQWYNLRRC